MLGQLQPWPHDTRFFRCHRGHVQRVDHGTCQQIIRHLFGHLQRHIFLCLGRGSAQVRGHDHVFKIEQWVLGCRFFFENVKGGACHMA